MRQDQGEFAARQTEVIIVGPEKAQAFSSYWQSQDLSFIGLPDPGHSVLKLYGQEINLFKLGRMPAQVIIDREGIVRWVHYGKSMSDIPSTQELISILDTLE